MLDENEWKQIAPVLGDQIGTIKEYRKRKNVDLKTAKIEAQNFACHTFYQLTGYVETNYLAIYHHRLSIYGDECPECGRLLRTPTARFCAQCGYRPVQ